MLPKIAPTPLWQRASRGGFFIQELVEDITITIHYVKTQDQLAHVGIKYFNKQRHRELVTKIRNFGT